MKTCEFCEYYNSCTGECEMTGQTKRRDDTACKYNVHIPYDNPDYDWEH